MYESPITGTESDPPFGDSRLLAEAMDVTEAGVIGILLNALITHSTGCA
jgi:hypothetical protein